MAASKPTPPPRPVASFLEIDQFFAGKSEVHKTMRRLDRHLKKAEIAYALIGGMALNLHGYEQLWGKVEVLLTSTGLSSFTKELATHHYRLVPGRKRTFVDAANSVPVHFAVAGTVPGFRKCGEVRYPDPEKVRILKQKLWVVDYPELIQTNLAAGWYQSLADVVNLIKVYELDERFLDRLHRSVRPRFLDCLEDLRRDQAFQAEQI